jgi:hypothetical protein
MSGSSVVFALALAAVLLPLAGWLGLRIGRRTARKHPGMAAALWVLSTFIKLDPPPPPKAERIVKDEEGAGDPPKV